MTGAIIGHFTKLGWEGERFQLGMLAVIVLIACSIVLFIRRHKVPLIGTALQDRHNPTSNED